ncbi:hypothetical protein [Streptomyces sp. NPDC046985]
MPYVKHRTAAVLIGQPPSWSNFRSAAAATLVVFGFAAAGFA